MSSHDDEVIKLNCVKRKRKVFEITHPDPNDHEKTLTTKVFMYELLTAEKEDFITYFSNLSETDAEGRTKMKSVVGLHAKALSLSCKDENGKPIAPERFNIMPADQLDIMMKHFTEMNGLGELDEKKD